MGTKIRHQDLLNEIRESHKNDTDYINRRPDQASGRDVSATQGQTEGSLGADGESRSEIETASRTLLGPDQFDGRDERSDEYESEGRRPGPQKARKTDLTPEEIAAEQERKRELHRVNQRLYQERKKSEKSSQQPFSPFSAPDSAEPELKNQSFNQNQSHIPTDSRKTGKNPFADANVTVKSQQKKQSLDDVKLVTASETDDHIEKLTDLFIRGSEVLDQILQIMVKGHEEVHIWELDELTARLLAVQQVDKAKKDKAAARTVRQLVAFHDKIFIFTILGPRFIQTGIHVKTHGGLSFK